MFNTIEIGDLKSHYFSGPGLSPLFFYPAINLKKKNVPINITNIIGA